MFRFRQWEERARLHGCYVDNFVTDPGAGGDTFGADDIGGVKFPRVKLIVGADGVNDGDVASGNPLPITATALTTLSGAVKNEDQASAGGDPGVVVLGMRQDSPAAVSGTDGDYEPLRIVAGKLVVDASLTTLTVGSHAVTNAGTFAVQESGAALTALQLIDDTVFTDDNAFTPATSKVLAVGATADETSPDAVNEGDIGALRMTLERILRTTPTPTSSGEGLDVFRSLDLDESEEEVKATAGHLYKLRLTNRTTSPLYVKLYNDTAANVIVGTTTPMDTIEVPANASDHTVLTENFGGQPLKFSTALCLACTTGFADADTGAPAANAMICSAYYK